MQFRQVAGTRAPIRMWADPGTVEQQAMTQLPNVAHLRQVVCVKG